MAAIAMNERAWGIVERMVADADALRVAPTRLANGALVLDCGVDVAGSIEAGLLFSAACMGGLGHAHLTHVTFDRWLLPAVQVWTDWPAAACMAAQFAGWIVQQPKFFAMGSGPARALIRAERKLYERLGYREQSSVAVLCLEGRKLPTPEVAQIIAEAAHVAPEQLALLVAPTASVVGTVQVAARIVETGLHKLMELGFDIGTVQSAFGVAPIAPVAADDLRTIGRTNDGFLYGGVAHYTVRAEDAPIAAVVARVPSASSADYGRPFYETLAANGGDFYKIDPLLFSPAEVFITNAASGRTFTAGGVNVEVLRRSFFG